MKKLIFILALLLTVNAHAQEVNPTLPTIYEETDGSPSVSLPWKILYEPGSLTDPADGTVVVGSPSTISTDNIVLSEDISCDEVYARIVSTDEVVADNVSATGKISGDEVYARIISGDEAYLSDFDSGNEGIAHVLNDTINCGVLHTIVISDLTGINISWTSGVVWDCVGEETIEIVAAGSTGCSDNNINYLYWDRDGGGTTLTLSTTAPDYTDNDVLVGIIVVEAGDIYEAHTVNILSQRENDVSTAIRDILKVVVTDGLLVSESTGGVTLDVQISAGTFYNFGTTRHNLATGFNTTTTAMTRWFHNDGTTWTNDTNAQIDMLNWDDPAKGGGWGLDTRAVGKYYKSMFMYSDNMIHWIYPQAEYDTIAQAIGAPLPVIPAVGEYFPRSVAVIMKTGDTAFPTAAGTRWIDIRPLFGTSITGIVTDHGNLAGLDDDDHTKYFADTTIGTRTASYSTTGDISGDEVYVRIISADYITCDKEITANADVQSLHIFGQLKVGDVIGTNDYPGIAHYDNATATNYALIQSPIGETFVNAATGQGIYLRINNTNQMTVVDGIIDAQDNNITTTGTVSADSVDVGNLYGNPFSDQQTYEVAGHFLEVLTDPRGMWAWLTPSDAGTEQDLTISNHDATYTDASDFTTIDQLHKGFVWSLDFDGSDDYLTVADHADFTFSTGDTTDLPFSIFAWVQVVDHTSEQQILCKANESGNQQEFFFRLQNTEILVIYLVDANVQKYPYRESNSALTVGWRFVVMTYDGTGGATAANGITFYVDGVLFASSATNDANYVAMEDTTGTLNIGARLNVATPSEQFQGDMGIVGVTAEELSSEDVWKLFIQTRGYYNE